MQIVLKKWLILAKYLLIVQWLYSGVDTLSYPIKATPGYVLKDTLVLFTPKQANQALQDGVNVDILIPELDSCKNIISEQEFLISRQDSLNSYLNASNKQYNAIIGGFETKEKIYLKEVANAQNKLKITSTINKIVYPLLGGFLLSLGLSLLFLHK